MPESRPMKHSSLRIPEAPRSIQKGSTLKDLLDREAVECLGGNLSIVHPAFDAKAFRESALDGLAPLGIMDRGKHIAKAMRLHLPQRFDAAVEVLLRSLTPPTTVGSGIGLAVFFYLPHSAFVAEFGHDSAGNGGEDPFDAAMLAQYEITKRFTAEFSMRPFLIKSQERTLARLMQWTADEDENVRRLCSEGSRPRLPWGMRIPAFIKDPAPTLPILEALKDDDSLYVQRSVANHLGDIAKDHPALVFELCERWLDGAGKARKWLIRHAVRHPAKKGVAEAIRLRKLAA
jgi:3-methyladenine DNA glycosylase AlkC